MGDNPDTLAQLLNILGSLATAVGELILWLGRLVFTNWLLIVWIAWWLWGVNWNKTWQVLARSWSEAQLLEFPILVGQYLGVGFLQNSVRIPLGQGNPGLKAR